MMKSVKKDFIQVTGILTGTYDLAPKDTRSVSAIHHLCVYEFEYEGVKYTYRMHKRDNFDPIPETLQLGFKKDPNKAFRVRENTEPVTDKSSNLPFYIFTGILIAVPFLFLYSVGREIQAMIADGDGAMVIIGTLVAVVLGIWLTRHALKSRETDNLLDQRIENAIMNNRVVTAYLVKTKRRPRSSWRDKDLSDYHRYNLNIGIYECEYKGRKYKIERRFSSDPPKSLKIYFDKNPKDPFYTTHS